MALSRREIGKDVVQQSAEAAITTTGHITAIIFDSVRKITTEMGSFATEIFEIREASKRAGQDAEEANPSDDQ
ncbi:MAG: hypothetical protein ABIR57_03245 [Aeromicrobium sp.]